MTDLPSGIVTFLLTDVDGSASLWERDATAMQASLKHYEDLMGRCVYEHDGIVGPRQTNERRLAVFVRATDAVAAAATFRVRLMAETWPTATPLHIRMALHTGEADIVDDEYVGLVFARGMHLRDVAHGGQIILSRATYDLVRDHYAQDHDRLSFVDLGEHRLRDLTRPEYIFQLNVPGVMSEFPILRTLDRHRHNLPMQRSVLIGREQEVIKIAELIRRPQVGLVTLTGPGGIGKTRLSLQVAADLLDDFDDGVYFVELAPITDPSLVVAAIAVVLGLKESTHQSLLETVCMFLRGKQLLLVLDNFEQVVSAAPVLNDLLKVGRGVKIIATSREVLHMYDEHEFAVPPLSSPNPRRVYSPDRLTQYAAVMLFIRRAQVVKPDFEVTTANAPAVAEICSRLDGLPLAIELAAARCKLLSPEALLQRLDNRLKLLVGGARDLHTRQQTLRGAIDWSYNLLDADEQVLFARLGIFVGGWTLEAAERIVWESVPSTPMSYDVFDIMSSFVDKSLIMQRDASADTDGTITDGMTTDRTSESHFTMLETIREYALERLVASSEYVMLRDAHIEYYAELAEAAETGLRGPEQSIWLLRLETEYENIRTALSWSIEEKQYVSVLRFVSALSHFWFLHGNFQDWDRWFEIVRGFVETTDATMRDPKISRFWARALVGRSMRAHYQENEAPEHAAIPARQSIELFEMLDDRAGMSQAITLLGAAETRSGAVEQGQQHVERALALASDLGDPWLIAWARLNQADTLAWQLSLARNTTVLGENLRFARLSGDPWLIGWALFSLGRATSLQGDYPRAEALLQESVAVRHAAGDKLGLAYALFALSSHYADQGRYDAALPLEHERLQIEQSLGNRRGIAWVLNALGNFAMNVGDDDTAIGHFEQSIQVAQEIDQWLSILYAMLGLATINLIRGDFTTARERLNECLRLSREANYKEGTAYALVGIGYAARLSGQFAEAYAAFLECLLLWQEMKQVRDIISTLDGIAGTLGTLGEHLGQVEHAAQIWGATEALRLELGIRLSEREQVDRASCIAQAQARLGSDAWAAAWRRGQSMSWQQITDAVLAWRDEPASIVAPVSVVPSKSTSASMKPTASAPTHGLTAREVQILRLVASGKTNKQVAEVLTISPATVNVHLSSVYSKLGVSSRAGATRFALENDLT